MHYYNTLVQVGKKRIREKQGKKTQVVVSLSCSLVKFYFFMRIKHRILTYIHIFFRFFHFI